MNTYLSTKYPHARDSRISFDEATHTYEIDGSSEGVISVTTLIHHHFPKFNANEVLKKMRKSKNGMDKYKGMTDEEIKTLWSENGKSASGQGTKMHKTIEMFYNDNFEYIYEEQPKEFMHFLSFHESIKARLTPFRTEWSIFRSDLKLAGQLDMLYKVNDREEYALYDWKRSKEIKVDNKYEKGLGPFELDHCNYVHYSIQLNIYKRILETLYQLPIVEMFLVVLHPDNETYKLFQVNEMKNEIDYIITERKKEMLVKEMDKDEKK